MSRLEISIFPLGEGMRWQDFLAIGREAERLGFAAVWHEDNMFPHPNELLDRRNPILDCWMAVSALAASTSTIRLGSMVSPAPRRHPALLAKAASTVDTISGGRLTIGIGGGDPTTAEHYSQWGLPFPEDPKERVALLREHLEVQRLLYTEEVSNYDGTYFQLRDAVNNPKPVQKPHPPIWLGLNTRTKVMPRIAAEVAQGVVVEWGDDDVARRVVPRLEEACAAIDRDPSEVTKARHMGVIFTDGTRRRSEVYEELAATSGMYDPAIFEETWETWVGALVGTPDQIRDELASRTIELGFDHVMFHVLSVHPDGDAKGVPGVAGSTVAGMRFLAEEVMPAFR